MPPGYQIDYSHDRLFPRIHEMLFLSVQALAVTWSPSAGRASLGVAADSALPAASSSKTLMSLIWRVSQVCRLLRSTAWRASAALCLRSSGESVRARYSARTVSLTSVGEIGIEPLAN